MRGLDIEVEARSGARSERAGPIRGREDSPEIVRQADKLEKDGAVIERIWDKAGLESWVEERAHKAARESPSPYAGDDARLDAARELGLRCELNREIVRVRYPEAQIEYSDAAGQRGRLNIGSVDERRQSQGQLRRESYRWREQDPQRERVSFDERKRQALTDIATYRVVSVKDLVEQRFGGNPYAARKGLESMKRQGLLQEQTVQVKSGKSFKVLTVTDRGRREARDRSSNGEQRYWAGFVKPAEMRHDAAVYQAARCEIEKLEKAGAKMKRVELDYEMKSRVARASERARAKGGGEEAQQARIAEARKMGLPVDEEGRVSYPDARIEYEDEMGVSGRVSIEVTSDSYRSKDIQAKAAAGFALHANGRGAMRQLASALGNQESRRGAGGGGRKDDELFEL